MAVSVNFKKPIKPIVVSKESRLIDILDDKIWFKRHYWDINVIDRQELINELDINDDEKLILGDIVLDIEELAKLNLDNDKIGFIPYLGRFSLHKGIRNIEKHRKEINQIYSKGGNRKDAKELVKKYYNEGMNEYTKEENNEKLYRQYKRIYKKEYNEYYQTIGKTYAEMFIWTWTLMAPIEFDEQFQKAFEKANNL